MRKIGDFMKAVENLFFLGIFILLLNSLSSAEVSISASVDRSQIALNESVQLSVHISGSGNVPAPQLPDLSNFSAYSSGRSQNISFINGQVSSSITYTYVLSPKNTGKFTIGPCSVTMDGRTFQTQPIEIEVLSSPPQQTVPSTPPQKARSTQAPGAFVKMQLNKSKAFVNEEVILTFRFYYRVSLISNPEYQAPEKVGFIFQDLPPPRNFVDTVNGVQYQVTEIKTALFPTKPGRETIPPASLKIDVQDFSPDPFSGDFFAQFFRGGGRQYLLKTEPVQLTVLPLPLESRSQNFSGGVGHFKMTASADKRKLSVGEPLTLTVSVSGSGNIKSIGDPVFPPFTGFRKYDTASSINIDTSNGAVEGSKVYKIVLVPQTSGLHAIPSIDFDYFHLPLQKYKVAATAPIQLEIFPSKSTAVVVSPLTYAPRGIQQIQQEIQYIKLAALPQKKFSWIHRSPWFVPVNLLPIFALLGAMGYRWRKSLAERDPQNKRFLHAHKKIKKALKNVARSREEKSAEAASRILEIVQNYFADKMGCSPSGLSFKIVENYLLQAGTAEPLIQRLKALWTDLELAAYAPTQFRDMNLQEILNGVTNTLEEIENQFKKSSHPFLKTLFLFSAFVSLSSSTFSDLINGSPSGSPSSSAKQSPLGIETLRERDSPSGSPSSSAKQSPYGIETIRKRDEFQEANKFFQEGRFQNAKEKYEEIKNREGLAFALEYNLGNAAYKLGDSGEAMAHWIRAWRKQPRDADVRYNLSLVSSQLGSPFFSDAFFLNALEFIYCFFSLNELSMLLILLLWASCLSWTWALLYQDPIFKLKNIVFSAALGLVLLWWGSRFHNEQVKRWAVVTEAKAEVRSGPGKQFAVGFTIPEGSRVLILNQNSSSDWTEIGVPKEGLKGWISKETVQEI